MPQTGDLRQPGSRHGHAAVNIEALDNALKIPALHFLDATDAVPFHRPIDFIFISRRDHAAGKNLASRADPLPSHHFLLPFVGQRCDRAGIQHAPEDRVRQLLKRCLPDTAPADVIGKNCHIRRIITFFLPAVNIFPDLPPSLLHEQNHFPHQQRSDPRRTVHAGPLRAESGRRSGGIGVCAKDPFAVTCPDDQGVMLTQPADRVHRVGRQLELPRRILSGTQQIIVPVSRLASPDRLGLACRPAEHQTVFIVCHRTGKAAPHAERSFAPFGRCSCSAQTFYHRAGRFRCRFHRCDFYHARPGKVRIHQQTTAQLQRPGTALLIITHLDSVENPIAGFLSAVAGIAVFGA